MISCYYIKLIDKYNVQDTKFPLIDKTRIVSSMYVMKLRPKEPWHCIGKQINHITSTGNTHSKQKSTLEHLFWCSRLSQIGDSI